MENFVLKRFRERFCSLKPIFYLEMGFEGRFGGAKFQFPNMGIEHLKKPRHNAVFSGIKKPPCFWGDFERAKFQFPNMGICITCFARRFFFAFAVNNQIR
ncbi:MAG: hypothetical protein II857_05895 [Selenomonadaceae bacterium]|nr:hypothetical protein [Selenomonadaceae bacterium]